MFEEPRHTQTFWKRKCHAPLVARLCPDLEHTSLTAAHDQDLSNLS